MRSALPFVCLFALLGSTPAFAGPITITFTTDTQGPKPNGFASNDSGLVTFASSSGTGLTVLDFTPQSAGRGLGLFAPGSLVLNFAVPVDLLSLQFGNDDTCCTQPGDEAVLLASLGGTLVASAAVPMNRNDLGDQTITVSNVIFDAAEFYFARNGDATLVSAIEVVDNITFNTAADTAAAVPEPTSMLLLGTGLAGLVARHRRKRNAARQ